MVFRYQPFITFGVLVFPRQHLPELFRSSGKSFSSSSRLEHFSFFYSRCTGEFLVKAARAVRAIGVVTRAGVSCEDMARACDPKAPPLKWL